MKVAIVCDSVGEFGGAERVVLALTELFPDAPIYTSFVRKGIFLDKLKGKKIIKSWAHYVPFFPAKLHYPLRFLIPLIWGSFDFSGYDLVISSSSWYVTKGFTRFEKSKSKAKKPIEISYCHTPPRWLWGLEIPTGKKNSFINWYIFFLAHFIRIYDFNAAQRVTYFVANSINVAKRIEKFYRRDAKVIYPPVKVNPKRKATSGTKREYYLIVSRITAGKGIEMAVSAANKLGIKLKIAGMASGYSNTYSWIKENALPNVELLGFVPDHELDELYAGAKAFFCLERDVDFGMTPVEAQGQGTPVIAYNAGGYKESTIDGKTGILFDDYSTSGLIEAIQKFENIKFKEEDCIKQAQKFSVERFNKELIDFIEEVVNKRSRG